MYKYPASDDFCDFKATKESGLRIFWEITKKCNLQCRYCVFYDNSHPNLPESALLSIGILLVKAGVTNIKLTGGEPLVHPGCKDLISLLNNNGVRVDLTTNATLIKKDFIDTTAKKLNAITISLDTASPELQNWLCRMDIHSRVIRVIEELLDNGLPLHINTVVSEYTLDGLIGLGELLSELGIVYWNWIGCDHDTGMLETGYYERLQDNLANRIEMVRREVVTAFPELVIRTVRCAPHVKFEPCPAGNNLLGITASGKLVPCLVLKHSSVDSIDISACRDKEAIRRYLDQISLPQCELHDPSHCGYCTGGCRGAAQEVSGNPFMADPLCWQVWNNNGEDCEY